jgi:hypothetical protein
MEDSEGNIIRMALHGLHTALAEVVPDLDRFVIASGNEAGLVCAWVEINIVDAFIMCIHGEIGAASAEGPHFV